MHCLLLNMSGREYHYALFLTRWADQVLKFLNHLKSLHFISKISDKVFCGHKKILKRVPDVHASPTFALKRG